MEENYLEIYIPSIMSIVFTSFKHPKLPISIKIPVSLLQIVYRERSGSVVECLTRDWGTAGSSLTGVTALCPWARTLILA